MGGPRTPVDEDRCATGPTVCRRCGHAVFNLAGCPKCLRPLDDDQVAEAEAYYADAVPGRA